MTNSRIPGWCLLGAFGILCSSLAQASSQRIFVSLKNGNNANPDCGNINTPCQTFTGGLAQTNPGGEMIVLDSGGYGSATITQAVTINAPPGVTAFVFPGAGGTAFTINAGASDVVVLRGLTLNGQNGTASKGIQFNSGAALFVENCVIGGFNSNGIDVAVSGTNEVFVNDTVFRNNGNGILVNTGGTPTMSVSRSRFENHSSRGIEVEAGKTAIKDSVASGNANAGFAAFFDAQMTIESCVVSHNVLFGILGNSSSGAGYVVRVSNSTITNNGIGLDRLSTGTLASRSNNTIQENGTDISAGVTTYFGQ